MSTKTSFDWLKMKVYIYVVTNQNSNMDTYIGTEEIII